MIDNSFRKILPRFTKKIILFYKILKLTPNQITLLGFVFALFSAYTTSLHFYKTAIFLWWTGRFFDGTDGIYARETNQTSPFGAYFDIKLDMAAYGIMLFGFAEAFGEFYKEWIIIMFLYLLCITGALALGNLEDKLPNKTKDNRGLRLAAGLAEAGETGIAYTLFLLFPEKLKFLLWMWIIILCTTIITRTILAKKELQL